MYGSSPYSFSGGEWHHMFITWDMDGNIWGKGASRYHVVYIDDTELTPDYELVPVDNPTTASVQFGGWGGLGWGQFPWGGSGHYYAFKGGLDNFMIWDGIALTDTNRQWLANNESWAGTTARRIRARAIIN
jgi:hypothetical protein